VIKIVKAEEHHIPDICKLWLEFMRYSEDIDPIFAPRDGITPVFVNEYLRPAMTSDSSLVLVALDRKKVFGYSYSIIQEPSNLNKRKRYGRILDLFVTKNYRRQGIGEKMYAEILKWFHSKDIDRVELSIIAKNRTAISFWEKHGFKDLVYNWYCQL
jgi:ribosomal protein S18 acetylase RimI-like enzyme